MLVHDLTTALADSKPSRHLVTYYMLDNENDFGSGHTNHLTDCQCT